jgi:hypothetical protein
LSFLSVCGNLWLSYSDGIVKERKIAGDAETLLFGREGSCQWKTGKGF